MLYFNFNPFPILTTPRLLLREMTKADAQAIFRLRSDVRVLQYLARHPITELAEAEKWLDIIFDAQAKNEGINWGICLREQPENLLGTIGFWRFDTEHHRAEIGYALAAEYWNKGIVTEAMTAALDYAFRQMNVHSIEANTAPENGASAQVLEKQGFVQEGYFREGYFFDGRFLDSRVYSKLNPHHAQS